jgi:omega-6 fatty acid desaturase (delta-12 desaturase)
MSKVLVQAALQQKAFWLTAHWGKSLLQCTVSLVSYSLVVLCLVWAVHIKSLAMASVLAMMLGLLLVRLFVIQHDCTHFAYFPARQWNIWVGRMLGVLTLTPFNYWRRYHLLHHGFSGDRDRRGYGDFYTLTVEEYQKRTAFEQFKYKVYRHPAGILLFGPLVYFLLKMRNPWLSSTWQECIEIVFINGFWGAVYSVTYWLEPTLWPLLLFHLLAIWVSGAIGLLLFYLQHQFEHVYWAPHNEWNAFDAAMKGSSMLVLPKRLEWLFGYINLHHVHHFNARIPNYRLKQVHDYLEQLALIKVRRIFFKDWKACFKLKLINQEHRLVGFQDISSV